MSENNKEIEIKQARLEERHNSLSEKVDRQTERTDKEFSRIWAWGKMVVGAGVVYVVTELLGLIGKGP